MFFEMFNAEKQEKKAAVGIFKKSYFRNQGPPIKKQKTRV